MVSLGALCEQERWIELCAQAAEKQDHERLVELVREINRLLAEKELRLRKKLRTSPVEAIQRPNPGQAVILVLVVGTIRLIGTNANNPFSSVASSIQ